MKVEQSRCSDRARSFFLFFILLGLLSCEGRDRTGSERRQNSPPVITSVQILPENPTVESELRLDVQGHDPDGDSMTFLPQWIRNGKEIVGERKNTLTLKDFKKGDSIEVSVIPSDGKTEGKPFLSSSVKILNSPPVLLQVDLEPNPAYANDTLKVAVKAFDADGDFIYYTYQWERNGTVLPEEKTETLPAGRFKKGDSISVTVTPDDRETLGKAKRSAPLTIMNSPPLIVSSPPTSTPGNLYTYAVKVLDPDDDPIVFTLKKGPPGMKIDPKSGLIQWEMGPQAKGTHLIEIEASDPEGARSFQRYTLTVDFR